MWGFGMRYAVTSGVLAANSILSGSNYDSEIKEKLLPLIKLSATNRMLLDRVGDRGFKRLANYWMKHQKKNNGDGLVFMERIYRLGLIRRLLWPLTNRILLKKIKYSDGRTGRRMPFRKSLKRDQWEMSERAKEISAEWKKIRSSGGKVSFTESD